MDEAETPRPFIPFVIERGGISIALTESEVSQIIQFYG